jgi:hypothetical protein
LLHVKDEDRPQRRPDDAVAWDQVCQHASQSVLYISNEQKIILLWICVVWNGIAPALVTVDFKW